LEVLHKSILIVLLSSVKFVVTPSFAALYQSSNQLAYWQVCLLCIIGGMGGVLVFSYFTVPIFNFIDWVKKKIFQHKLKPRKVFTKRNRLIVKIWRGYGLFGIAALTPVLISIPIGTIVACHLERRRTKVFLYLFISIVTWSLLLNSVYYL